MVFSALVPSATNIVSSGMLFSPAPSIKHTSITQFFPSRARPAATSSATVAFFKASNSTRIPPSFSRDPPYP